MIKDVMGNIHREVKSVIDFALMSDKFYDKFVKMKIDEENDQFNIYQIIIQQRYTWILKKIKRFIREKNGKSGNIIKSTDYAKIQRKVRKRPKAEQAE